jgi:hypothetical protein
MSDLACIWEEMVSGLGYDYLLYDIGELGRGPKLALDTPTFKPLDERRPGMFPGCLYKPALVEEVCRAHPGALVAYMDVDAFPVARLDELEEGDYDIAVTLRINGDLSTPKYFELMGMINAGVILFRSNDRTLEYVQKWKAKTLEFSNDQKALNASLDLDTGEFWKEYDGCWSFSADERWINALHQPGGSDVVFRFLPAAIYNWYRPYVPDHEIKVLHCRGEKKNMALLDQYR